MDECQKTLSGGVTSAGEGERENETRKRKRNEEGEQSNLEPGRTNDPESSRSGPNSPHLSSQQSKPKEPKHTIFLSHSGAQKEFTRFLFKALEDANYETFFDEDPRSLPEGEKWYNRLIEAARECRVAVLVLSREFFTKTKWPMLELNEFARIQKRDDRLKVLPLFLDITFEEFERSKNEKLWYKDWTKWKESDNSNTIDLEEWHQALSIIKKNKALSYQREGQPEFIQKVVEAIFKLVNPDVKYDVPENQSIGKVCSKILPKMKEISPSTKYKVKVMGLYGMGGIGKTTISRAICNEMLRAYGGKVCHIELGHMTSLEVQKKVLKELTHANPTTLDKHHGKLHGLLEERIKEHEVFFVIDNVQSHDVEEALKYLQVEYHEKSMILVTSRSLHILVELSISKRDCMEMPPMDYGIAKEVFSYYLGQNKSIIENGDIIEKYVDKCSFVKEGSGDSEKWYHPLALKALGSQLQRLAFEEWELKTFMEKLKDQRFESSRESKHPIFSILRLGYDTLSLEDQYIFLDLALLWTPRWKNWGFDMKYMWRWMCIMHRKSEEAVDKSVYALQRNGLLDSNLYGSKSVYIHDLYIDFAEAEAQKGVFRKRRYFIDENGVDVPLELLKNPPGSCWANLERMIITNSEIESFKKAKLKWCSNVEVLYLYKCNKLHGIDLRWLENLRSFEVVECPKLVLSNDEVEGLSNLSFIQISDCEGAFLHQLVQSSTYLQILIVHNCSKLRSLEGISNASSLKILDISNCGNLKELPSDLRRLKKLEEVIIKNCNNFENLGDIQALKALRKLVVDFCKSLKVLPKGFSGLKQLEQLELSCCFELWSLEGIEGLWALEKLNASRCSSLKELPKDLSGLRRLDQLELLDCLQLWSLEGIQGLEALKKLNASGCPSVKELPKDLRGLRHLEQLELLDCSQLGSLDGIQGLEALVELNAYGCISLRELPKDLSGLKHLEQLVFRGCMGLSSLDGIEGLGALKKLNASRCYNLKELPKGLSRLKHLEELDLYACSNLTSLNGVQGLRALKMLDASNCRSINKLPKNLKRLMHLEELDLTKCFKLWSLDGIQGLKVLRKLDASYCFSLKKVPKNFSGLRHLEQLYLPGCSRLQSLDGIEGLEALIELDAHGCSSLKELPKSLNTLKHLEQLDLLDCKVTSLDGIQGLKALKKLGVVACSNILRLPEDLDGLIHLEELYLSECSNLCTLDGIQDLVVLRKLDASDCSSLEELPKDLSGLKNLEELNLSGSKLWSLESIQDLRALKTLEALRCSNLKELPKNLSGLKNLEKLDISCCSQLWSLDGIEGLKALKRLYIRECCSLKELPKDLSGLKNLEQLDLSECSELCSLDGIQGFEVLKKLDASYCSSLKELPKSLSGLRHLEELHIAGCSNLTSLNDIQGLEALMKLDVPWC